MIRERRGDNMNLFHKEGKVQEKTNQTENLIREYAFLDMGKLYGVLDSRPSGLTEEEAEEKLDEFGENEIEIDSKNNMFTRLIEAIINPFINSSLSFPESPTVKYFGFAPLAKTSLILTIAAFLPSCFGVIRFGEVGSKIK